MKHRACRALLCLVLAASLLLPMTVGALAGSTTIGTDASRSEYFEALGASGNYNPLKTPYHYDKTTGKPGTQKGLAVVVRRVHGF